MSLRRAALVAGLVLAFTPFAALAQQKGPPDDIAAGLRALGPVIDPPAVMKFYGPLQAKQPTDGVTVTRDIAYGPDERNVLDLYEPSAKPAGSMPVLIFVHGGAFRFGDKKGVANIGYYFARHGVLTIDISYRLVPKARWPSGGEDVGKAVAWARANVASHGGDAKKIVLMGHSAGAVHAATYAFTKSLQPKSGSGLAGLVLVSGVYDINVEYVGAHELHLPSPNPINDDYFGADAKQHECESLVRHITAAKLPVMQIEAELDPAMMLIENGELFGTLCQRDKACPQILWLAGHDHISEIAAINTGDESLSMPVLDFIKAR